MATVSCLPRWGSVCRPHLPSDCFIPGEKSQRSDIWGINQRIRVKHSWWDINRNPSSLEPILWNIDLWLDVLEDRRGPWRENIWILLRIDGYKMATTHREQRSTGNYHLAQVWQLHKQQAHQAAKTSAEMKFKPHQLYRTYQTKTS